MSIADTSHAETCRGLNCGTIAPRDQLVPAAKVLGPGKRGWFCPDCAFRYRARRSA